MIYDLELEASEEDRPPCLPWVQPFGGLPFIACLDGDEVVGPSQVQLHKEASCAKLLQSCWNQRQGVLVLNNHIVQTVVVNTCLRPLSFFLTKRKLAEA